MKELLEPAGFACTIQDLGDKRANFIAQTGKGDGPELIWNGHMDVVPAAKGWKTNPLELSREGEKVYGRGGVKRGTLKLLFVSDEENANKGIRAYLREYGNGTEGMDATLSGYAGKAGERYVIIGEPTNLEVAVAHMGVLHAIEKMNGGLKAREHLILPPPGISVTMVRAYEKDNIVPGMVRLLTDFRILPDMSREEAEEMLRDAIAREGIPVQIANHFFMPGGEIMPEETFVKLCCRTLGSIRGRETAPQAFAASCEQCFLTGAGFKTIMLGPGSLEQAHTENEFLKLEQLNQAVIIYEEIAQQILG